MYGKRRRTGVTIMSIDVVRVILGSLFPAGLRSPLVSTQGGARSTSHPGNWGFNKRFSTMQSSRTIAIGAFFLYAFLLVPTIARAQYGATPFHDPATGEVYHIEGGLAFWNPPPDLKVTSESLGIPGTQIDAATDLGIAQHRITE